MTSADSRCYDQAVKLLALRPHFRNQLAAKLAQRGFDDEEVIAVLDRLVAQGYLDDERLTREAAMRRVERGGEGARRVRAELLRRGAPAAAVEAALREVAPADDAPAAAAAARSWLAHGRVGRDALARFLDRKGFTSHGIVRALAELEAELAAGAAADDLPDSETQ